MGARLVTLRRHRWQLVCLFVGFVLCLILFSLAVVARYLDEVVVYATACACVLSGVWTLGWHSSVKIYAGGLVVTNAFHRHLIPWAAVRRVEIDYGLWIRLVNGQPIESTQFGGSLLGERTGYRSYHKTVERLEKARREAHALSMSDVEEYRTRLAVPWLALLVIFGSVITLTVLGGS